MMEVNLVVKNELRRWPMGAEHQQYEKDQKLQNVSVKT